MDEKLRGALFKGMAWVLGTLLTGAGLMVGYFYRSSQEAIAQNFQEIHAENAKQWDRIGIIERKQDALEWVVKQNQIDLAAMKGKH